MADKQISALTDAAAITARVSAHIVQGANSREYSGALGRWILLGGAYTSAGIWSQANDGSASSVLFTGLGEAADILIVADGVTCSVSSQIILRLSTNNGSSYFSTSGNYSSIAADGQLTSSTGLFMNTAAATAARSASALIFGANVSGAPKSCLLLNRSANFRFNGSNSPINAVQLVPSGGGNFSGGNIYCYIRA